MKKLELDAAQKTCGYLINQAENVHWDFDEDIEAYKARESKRTRLTTVYAIIGKQKTLFHVFLSLLVKVNFLMRKTKILEKNSSWIIDTDSSFTLKSAFVCSAVLRIVLRYLIRQYLSS